MDLDELGCSNKAHDYAMSKLIEAGAIVLIGVAAVHPDHVEFDDGSTVAADGCLVAVSRLRSSRRQLDRLPGGVVAWTSLPDLKVDGFPGVYAVGDVANIPSGGDGARRCHSLGPSRIHGGQQENDARASR